MTVTISENKAGKKINPHTTSPSNGHNTHNTIDNKIEPHNCEAIINTVTFKSIFLLIKQKKKNVQNIKTILPKYKFSKINSKNVTDSFPIFYLNSVFEVVGKYIIVLNLL